MVVSAVDVLDVFGRSFVLSDQVPSSPVFGGNQLWWSCVRPTDPGWVTAALNNNISVFILV